MTTPMRVTDLVEAAAAAYGRRAAIREDGDGCTYADLVGRVAAIADRLAALGVRPGDRVVVVAENTAWTIVAWLALGHLDAWPMLASARLAPGEIDALVERCDARLVLYVTVRFDAVARHAGRRGARTLFNGPPGSIAVEDRPGDRSPEPVPANPGAAVAAMISTSGSTGEPKAAMLTHANLVWLARTQSRLRRYGPDDRVYLPLPIVYAGALASISLTALASGACLHLAARFSAADLARSLREDGITVVPGVPALHARVVAWARDHAGGFAAPRVRMVTSASSPLDRDLKASVEALYDVPLQNGYGLTETTAVVAQTRLDEPRADASVGRPLPAVDVRIVDDDGHSLGAGAIGRIEVRGPNLFRGYYRDADATRAAFTPDGWLRTGDLGFLDSPGELGIVGRVKDVIKHAGYTVHPAEVEAALAAHPAVVSAAIVGRPRGADEEIVAYVQLVDGASLRPGELAAFVADRIAGYKIPREIRVVPSLPALANGKPDRMALRRIVQPGATRTP